MSISWLGKRYSENCWYKLSFWTRCSSSSFSSGVLKNFMLLFVSNYCQKVWIVWTMNLFNFSSITQHILRKTIHCIRFYVRCWMGIWIHHLISRSQKFGLACIIQRYHPLTFYWVFTVYYPEVCILLFNGHLFSVNTYQLHSYLICCRLMLDVLHCLI
jgi:hypothetical protein